MSAQQTSRCRNARSAPGFLDEGCVLPPSGAVLNGGERARMADLAFAVLLVAGFLVLALTLRGLEKL
jgi:hypothetical protein